MSKTSVVLTRIALIQWGRGVGVLSDATVGETVVYCFFFCSEDVLASIHFCVPCTAGSKDKFNFVHYDFIYTHILAYPHMCHTIF